MLQFVLLHALDIRMDHRPERNDRQKKLIQLCQIPVITASVIGNAGIYRILHNICDHLIDDIAHTFSVQYTETLCVDDLSLLIHNLIVFQKRLSDTIVIAFDLLLGCLDRLCQHLMLDLLSFLDTERIEHRHHTI